MNDESIKKLMEESTLKDSDRFRFVIGGKAVFVITSLFTNRNLVFYVMKPKDKRKSRYMRNVFTRDGNKWAYIGPIYLHLPGRPFHYNNRSNISKKDYRVVGFEWTWYRINRNIDFNNQAIMKHAGKCARCGRKLTDELSIERGFGPHCFDKVNKEERKWLTK